MAKSHRYFWDTPCPPFLNSCSKCSKLLFLKENGEPARNTDLIYSSELPH